MSGACDEAVQNLKISYVFFQQQCSGPTPAKKPRTKPSVQDVDVEGLAREGQVMNTDLEGEVMH